MLEGKEPEECNTCRFFASINGKNTAFFPWHLFAYKILKHINYYLNVPIKKYTLSLSAIYKEKKRLGRAHGGV
jgi:hypothetical protein